MNISLSRSIVQPTSPVVFLKNISPIAFAITAIALVALGTLALAFYLSWGNLWKKTETPSQEQNGDSVNNSKEKTAETKADQQQPITTPQDKLEKLANGEFRKTYANGKIEEGEFNSNEVLLKGKRIEPDGTIYEGRFVAGMLKEGTKKYPQGHKIDVETGDFNSDCLIKGKRVYALGRIHEGYFVNGILELNLTIKTLSGITYAIKILVNEPCSHLFEKASSVSGLPRDQLRLLYCGRQINDFDNETLDDFDIKDKRTIDQVLKLKGD